MADNYNQTGMINFTDEASLKMFDKLRRTGTNRRITPINMFDNIPYEHRTYRDEYNLLIGDCCFTIPPEFIAVTSEAQSSKSVTIRQDNTQRTKGGYHRRTILIDLVFHGNEQINGYPVDGPEGTYYVDGLRQLLAQFKSAPFLPVLNELINNVYNIWAVALQDITIGILNGFPEIMTAQITLLETNLFPYLEVPNLFYSDMIDWDLFRFYYQRLLTSDHEYKKLQMIPDDKTKEHFKLSILDSSVFENKQWREKTILDVITDTTILREGHNTNYVEWLSSEDCNLSIIDFQCKYANILTNIQLADAGEPTMQYLGGLDTIFQITIETNSNDVVQAIEQCQITNDLYTRNNQKYQSVGFVKLESELVEFCGGLFVMIENVTTSTVPGYPGLYHVVMQCVSYDIAQSAREALNGFVPFVKDGTKSLKDQAISQDYDGLKRKINQDLYAEHKIRTEIEMYPDLQLPTYKEVDEVIKKIKKFRSNHLTNTKEVLEPYPLDMYPRNPTESLHGLPPINDLELSVGNENVFSAGEIVDQIPAYDIYVDPDFYVFYPFTYTDIAKSEKGIFTDFHKNVINEKKKVTCKSNTYSNNFIDSDESNTNIINTNDTTTTSIENLIAMARQYIGNPYVWGACGDKTASGQLSFDCSGFVCYVMQKAGLLTGGHIGTADLPKKTSVFEEVELTDIKRGDLVHRYPNECGHSTGHVGFYLGNNKTVEAMDTRHGVTEGSVNTSRFQRGLRIKTIQNNPYSMSTQNIVGSYSSPTINTGINLIYSNEGEYGTVTPNDGGAISIGRGQWNADRAKALLKDIVSINPSQAKDILGTSLYNEIIGNTSSWKSYVPNNEEAKAISELLSTSYGKSEQDKTMQRDLAGYIQIGQGYGLTNQKALLYFADGIHQYGTNSAKWKTIAEEAVKKGGSLLNIYEASQKILGGQYSTRRKNTYLELSSRVSVTEGSGDSSVTYVTDEITLDNAQESVNKDKESILTKDELDSICRIVAAETIGEPYQAQIAMAQCVYDRLTNTEKKYGTLNNILYSTEQFKKPYDKDYSSSTIEAAVKDVFCNAVRWKENDSVWYFISNTDAPNSYENLNNTYDKLGAEGTHVFWGKNGLTPSTKTFIIEGELGSMVPGEETINQDYATKLRSYDANIINIEDVDNFAVPVLLNTNKAIVTGRRDLLMENDEYMRKNLNNDENIFNTSFVNEYQYAAKGKLVRAFPAYLFCILDDQAQWYDGRKLWTNYYTRRAVVDIQVHESIDTPTSTATVVATNTYHNLDRTASGISRYDLRNDSEYGPIRQFLYKETGVMLGFGPKLTNTLCELHAKIYNHALLREGARIHLRLGYGSDPFSYDTVMNGYVSDLTLGEQVSIVAVSDGTELLNNRVSAKKNSNNNGWFGLFGLGESQEASNIIANQMCERTNNIINYWWKGTFEASKNNIEHFGLYFHNLQVLGDDVIGYQTQYDILKNVYRSTYKASWYVYNTGLTDGEKNIVFSSYNKTPWDVFQICTQSAPEYILKPHAHQFDSRLFYGLPVWMEKYRYNMINDKVYEECKSASQVHFIDSMTDIVDNQVRVTSRDSFTNARVMYQSGSSSVTTGTLYSDRTIDFSKQKTKIIDSAVVQDALGPDWIYEHTFYELGQKTAHNIGVSNLLIGWEKQYKSGVILLGKPGVHAHDYLMINDTHVNMFGLSKAREVFHSFNSNTGFITTVVPGMIGFQTDNDSGMVLPIESYLKTLVAFSSYTFIKKQMNNNYQNYANIYSAIQSGIKTIQAKNSIDDIAKFTSISTDVATTAFAGVSIKKWGTSVWGAYKAIRNGENLTKALSIANSVGSVKEAYGALKAARNLKNVSNVLKTAGLVANECPIIGQIVYLAIWLVCDAILDAAIEWFANRNVVTLLPMWYENYPFVSGVKDGENILVMKSNPNATQENNDTTMDDPYMWEDY